jgi:D-glucosaminate-6-phosphate ammonia-lyase
VSIVDAADPYAFLGVRKLINAYETVSILGATRIHPEVARVMERGRDAFVDLTELQRAIGVRLAALTRNPAAAVCSGASAGLLLATYACAEAKFPGFVRRLTNPWRGPTPTVIVQRVHHGPYVQNVQQAGVALIDVGYTQNRTPREILEAAFDPTTAAVLYTAGYPYERDGIPLPIVAEIAASRGVPVIVDAAALVPPAENLWRFGRMGADLVVISGGKGLQGPQDSGMVLGRSDLIDTVQRIAPPLHGVGRASKSSKEDMLGLLAAVERALEDDEPDRYARLRSRAERIAQGLAHRSELRTEIVPTGRQGQPNPRVVVVLTAAAPGDRDTLIAAMRHGEPGVVIGAYEGDERAVAIHPLSLTDAEAEIVVRALLHALDERLR